MECYSLRSNNDLVHFLSLIEWGELVMEVRVAVAGECVLNCLEFWDYEDVTVMRWIGQI